LGFCVLKIWSASFLLCGVDGEGQKLFRITQNSSGSKSSGPGRFQRRTREYDH
jgi:hypothetical protein